MKPREAFGKIFAGMRADLHDYRRLRELLESQFIAALNHRTDDIRVLGEDITALASTLDLRRRERFALATLLVPAGAPVSISTLAQRLQGASRSAFDTCWASLETAVRDCKALNARNCALLMGQYDIMQRVLQAEENTYAPA